MTTRSLTVVAALALAALTAPAAAAQDRDDRIPAQILRGRSADIHLADEKLTGELLAFQSDTLWVTADDGLLAVPASDIRRLSIHRHGLDTRAVLLWTGVGAGLSALGMSVACSNAEDADCGGVAPTVLLSWALFGGVFGWALAGSSRENVQVAAPFLQPYLRFPTGLPEARRAGSDGVGIELREATPPYRRVP